MLTDKETIKQLGAKAQMKKMKKPTKNRIKKWVKPHIRNGIKVKGYYRLLPKT